MSETDEKPFTELFKKSGLMEKHLSEFKRWRLVNEDEEGAKNPEQTLDSLVQDIGELLEREQHTLPQTRLSPLPPQAPQYWIGMNTDTNFHAVRDEMGNLVVGPQVPVVRGERYTPESAPGTWITIEDIEELFEGGTVVAKLLKISK